MKRILAFCLTIALCALLFTGCYTIDPATEADLLGTYELTRYTRSGSDLPEAEDLIEQKHIVCWLVVSDIAQGYYYYRDDETDAYCYAVELRLTTSTDEEDFGKYTYLEYRLGETTDWFKLGVRSSSFFRKTSLNSTLPTWSGNLFKGNAHISYSTHTVFQKKSGATDLSYLKKKVGEVTVSHFTPPQPESESESF